MKVATRDGARTSCGTIDENRSRSGGRSLDAVLVEVKVAESTDMLASRAPDFALSLRLQEATSGKPGTNENAENGTKRRLWSPDLLATVHGDLGDPGVHGVSTFGPQPRLPKFSRHRLRIS